MKIYQVILYTFIVGFKQGNAIRCYDCTTGKHDVIGVTDGCIGQSPTTCPSGQNYCIISTSSSTNTGRNTRAEIRACTSSSQAQPCRIVVVAGIKATVCSTICDTDGCNRGSSSDSSNTPKVNIPNSGLKCYQCTYSSEASINNCDGASPTFCSSGQNFCSAISGTFEGISVIHRTCSTQPLQGCASSNGLRACSTSCSTDGCNGSGKKELCLIGFLLTAIISYVIMSN